MRPEKTLIFRPIAVVAESDFSYRIDFQQENCVSSFSFTVDKDFQSVSWDHEFWVAMGGDLNPATPLFKCIYELHQARQFTE